MTTTYTDLVTQPYLSSVLYASIVAPRRIYFKQQVTGTTYALPGFGTDYFETRDGLVETSLANAWSVLADGMYLTGKSSLADCEANVNSFFQDLPNNILYVNTTGPNGTTTPATTIKMIAYCYLLFSTKNNGPNFLGRTSPRITAFPAISLNAQDLLAGIINSGSVNISLNNADGYFDSLFKVYSLRGAYISLYLGSGDRNFSGANFVDVYNGYISDWQWNNDTVVLQLIDYFIDLQRQIPALPISGGSYYNTFTSAYWGAYMPPENSGKLIPIAYGIFDQYSAKDLTCVYNVAAYSGSYAQFCIAAHEITAVTGVWISQDNGATWVSATLSATQASGGAGSTAFPAESGTGYFYTFRNKDVYSFAPSYILVRMNGAGQAVVTGQNFQSTVTINNFASGRGVNTDYASVPTPTFSAPGGGGGTATGHCVCGVTASLLSYPFGFDLSSDTQVTATVSGGAGTGASLTVQQTFDGSRYHVTGFTVTQTGTGYTGPADIVVAGTNLLTPGSGISTKTYTGYAGIGVVQVICDSGGSGYVVTPTITIPDPVPGSVTAEPSTSFSAQMAAVSSPYSTYQNGKTRVKAAFQGKPTSTLSGIPMTNPSDIVKDLLLYYGTYRTSNSAAFAASKAASSLALNMYITSPIRVLDVITKICQSDMAYFFLDSGGTFNYRNMVHNKAATASIGFDDTNVISSSVDYSSAHQFGLVQIGYAAETTTTPTTNPALAAKPGQAYVTATNTALDFPYTQNLSAKTVQTYLTSAADAAVLATRMLALQKNPAAIVTLKTTLVGAQYVTSGILNIGDTVNVNLLRSPGDILKNRVLEVIGVRSDFSNATVDVTLIDYGNTGIGHYSPDNMVGWDAATYWQRVDNGFYSDANGYPNAHDGASYNSSVYW